MSADEQNQQQENNLATLRAKIAEKRSLLAFDDNVRTTYIPPEIQVVTVPEITIEPFDEFNLDRHVELVFRLEAIYTNYLYYRQQYEHVLRQVCKAEEELLKETLKPRF